MRSEGNRQVVFLEKTIFYPPGGGQPADHGSIEDPSGLLQVSDVKYRNLVVHHLGKIEAEDRVKCSLDRDRRYRNSRYRNMRVHTAGHLVHDVLMEIQEYYSS